MVNIFFEIVGDQLDLLSIKSAFKKFKINEAANGIAHVYCSDIDLTAFLKNILKHKASFKKWGIKNHQLWFLELKSEQGNGELSVEEIKLIAELETSFCWTYRNK